MIGSVRVPGELGCIRFGIVGRNLPDDLHRVHSGGVQAIGLADELFERIVAIARRITVVGIVPRVIVHVEQFDLVAHATAALVRIEAAHIKFCCAVGDGGHVPINRVCLAGDLPPASHERAARPCA